MDISSLKPSEAPLEINHPGTGQPLGIRVSIMSLDDPRMKKIKREIRNRRLRLEQRGKAPKAEEMDEDRSNLIFSAMTGWEWYGDDVTFQGSKPDFNRAKVLEVFDALPWFLDQIDEAIGDEKAFYKASELN